MTYNAPLLGNESATLIEYDDTVLQSLRATRRVLASDSEPTVVISARCDLLKEELHQLYAGLLKSSESSKSE